MTRTRLLLAGFVLSVAVAPAATLSGQIPDSVYTPTGEGSLSGRAIDGVTGKPIQGVSIVTGLVGQIRTSGGAGGMTRSSPFMMETDAEGRFSFARISSGRLTIFASAAGYLDSKPGKLGPTDEFALGHFDLAPNERLADLVVKLWPSAAIGGVVEDDVRDPIVGASVQLLSRQRVLGVDSWGIAALSTRTDDRGRYRFNNVVPGEYVVVAPAPTPARRGEPMHATVFYPDTTDFSSATRVRAAAGDRLDSINLTVKLTPPASAVTLAGRIIGPADRVSGLTIRLTPVGAENVRGGYDTRQIKTGVDGAFRLTGLLPGRYRLVAASMPDFGNAPKFLESGSSSWLSRQVNTNTPPPLEKLQDLEPLWADTRVELTQSMDDFSLALRPGARIKGHVVFDLAGAPLSEAQLVSSVMGVVPVAGMPLGDLPQSRVEADGTFASIKLPAGRYWVSLRPNWPLMQQGVFSGLGLIMTSMRVNGVEQFGPQVELGDDDLALVVTISDKRTSITGTVADAQGARTSVARVFVFPRDPQLRATAPLLARQVNVERDGKFTLFQTPPGDYLAVALSTVPDDWSSPESLEKLTAMATRVEVALGDIRTVDLRVRALP